MSLEIRSILTKLNPEMPKKRVSMRDIAEVAQVDPSTVSLALRNDPRITPATIDKVKKVAQKLGYRRDPILSSLAANRWHSPRGYTGNQIVWLTPDRDGQEIRLQTHALQKRSQELGYSLSRYRLEEGVNIQRLTRLLYNRNVRGLIVSPPYQKDFFDSFDWEPYCSVAMGMAHGTYYPPTHLVMNNITLKSLQALEKVKQLSIKRIGIVLGWTAGNIFDVMRNGPFAHEQISPTSTHKLSVITLDKKNKGALRDWLKKFKPEVIIGSNDYILAELQKAGTKIPKYIPFCSLSKDRPDNDIAGLYLDKNLLAEKAVELLDSLIHQHQYGLPKNKLVTMVETEWMDGKTLPSEE